MADQDYIDRLQTKIDRQQAKLDAQVDADRIASAQAKLDKLTQKKADAEAE